MREAEKDVREHLDAVKGWRPDASAFDVRLAMYTLALESENIKLRAIITANEFDALTGGADGLPVWLRKLANDVRAGDTLHRNADRDASMLVAIASLLEVPRV